MKSFINKYRELLSYLFFGVLTTAVNFVVFYAMEALLPSWKHSYLVSNAVAWIASVIFAYVTNKIFVFRSENKRLVTIVREFSEFLGARVFSFAVEEAGLVLFVDALGFRAFSAKLLGFSITGELISKVILAVIVVIMNYFFSKFIIFKKK